MKEVDNLLTNEWISLDELADKSGRSRKSVVLRVMRINRSRNDIEKLYIGRHAFYRLKPPVLVAKAR